MHGIEVSMSRIASIFLSINAHSQQVIINGLKHAVLKVLAVLPLKYLNHVKIIDHFYHQVALALNLSLSAYEPKRCVKCDNLYELRLGLGVLV